VAVTADLLNESPEFASVRMGLTGELESLKACCRKIDRLDDRMAQARGMKDWLADWPYLPPSLFSIGRHDCPNPIVHKE
jgi:hypothetical protein